MLNIECWITTQSLFWIHVYSQGEGEYYWKTSIQFALDIIVLYKKMVKQKEYVLSKQLLRSSTSIGAHVQEAQAAHTIPVFAFNMSIASKEARESRYWLMLIEKSQIVEANVIELSRQAESIVNILTKIVKTSQASLKR